MFGPLDVFYEYAAYLLLALVLLNAVTRLLAHNKHVSQYRDNGAESVQRYAPHDVANVLLLLGSFYYLTVSLEAGIIVATLVVGLVVTDFFEFEGRKVEARNDKQLQIPKAGLAAWGVVFVYVAYRSLFIVVEPLWDVIVA